MTGTTCPTELVGHREGALSRQREEGQGRRGSSVQGRGSTRIINGQPITGATPTVSVSFYLLQCAADEDCLDV